MRNAWTRFVPVAITAALVGFWSNQADTAADEIIFFGWNSEAYYGSWVRSNDDRTSAGVATASVDRGWASTDVPPLGSSNYIDFHFWARGSTRYRLWLRLRAANDSKWNDSVWVQFTESVNAAAGTPVYRIGSDSALLVNLENCAACGVNGWGWQNHAWWLPDTGDVWFDRDGEHTMRIWIREDGVALDEIVLSPSKYLNGAPGPVIKDFTWLPYLVDSSSPPLPVNFPVPFNGATAVPPSAVALYWDSGGFPCSSRDLYLGTVIPFPQFATDPCAHRGWIANLSPATTYYWRVDTHAMNATTTGRVWHFTTGGASPENVVIYPTDVSWQGLRKPWLIAADPAGTQGDSPLSPRVLQTIDQGWESLNTPPSPAVNYIDVRFWAEPQVPYHVWLRMRAQDDSKWNDSVWVQFDNSLVDGVPAYRIGSSDALLVNLENCRACGLQEWGWQDSSWWLQQPATVTFEGIGERRMRLMVREDGVSVDQVVLSPSQFLTARPGSVTNDQTIVPKP